MTSKTFRTLQVPVNFSHHLWARSRKLFSMGFEMLGLVISRISLSSSIRRGESQSLTPVYYSEFEILK